MKDFLSAFNRKNRVAGEGQRYQAAEDSKCGVISWWPMWIYSIYSTQQAISF